MTRKAIDRQTGRRRRRRRRESCDQSRPANIREDQRKKIALTSHLQSIRGKEGSLREEEEIEEGNHYQREDELKAKRIETIEKKTESS